MGLFFHAYSSSPFFENFSLCCRFIFARRQHGGDFLGWDISQLFRLHLVEAAAINPPLAEKGRGIDPVQKFPSPAAEIEIIGERPRKRGGWRAG